MTTPAIGSPVILGFGKPDVRPGEEFGPIVTGVMRPVCGGEGERQVGIKHDKVPGLMDGFRARTEGNKMVWGVRVSDKSHEGQGHYGDKNQWRFMIYKDISTR